MMDERYLTCAHDWQEGYPVERDSKGEVMQYSTFLMGPRIRRCSVCGKIQRPVYEHETTDTRETYWVLRWEDSA